MVVSDAHDSLLARLDRLEARIDQLEATATSTPSPAAPAGPTTPADSDTFAPLNALKELLPEPGGVQFTGAVTVGAGHFEFQWARPTQHLQQTDWAEHADTIAALGHPLRLTILQHLLEGERTVAQLVDELGLASTGVAYHHLSALQAVGWVTSPRRGAWALPAPRIVPLLTILIALEKG